MLNTDVKRADISGMCIRLFVQGLRPLPPFILGTEEGSVGVCVGDKKPLVTLKQVFLTTGRSIICG